MGWGEATKRIVKMPKDQENLDFDMLDTAKISDLKGLVSVILPDLVLPN